MKKVITEQIYTGIYIDSDGCAITLIDLYNYQSQGLKVIDEYFIKDISLEKINKLLIELRQTKYITRIGINKPFNKDLLAIGSVVVEDLDFDIFNGLIHIKSMINDRSLNFKEGMELIKVLRDYEKDTINHRVFSLIVAVALIVKNLGLINFWNALNNYYEGQE